MTYHGNVSEFRVGNSISNPISNHDAYPPRPTPEVEARARAAVASSPHPLRGWTPPDLAKRRPEVVVREPETGWPGPLEPSAFQGVAGEFVDLVLPETEADPAALLLTFLVGVGSMIGRGPHYRVGASNHGVNLFGVVVGETAKARKGTATDLAIHILERADPQFMASRMASGLSSGEGLIQAVRDSREEDVSIKPKDGSPVHFERQIVDSGEADKRLLVVESEFGGVLQQTGREGNILSSVLRQAWDGKPLRILARTNKDNCQEPHISLIGNVTVEELKRLLTTNDRANGFGNRILWCCARRSKLLSRGGRPLDERLLNALAGRVRGAVQKAQQIGLVGFDEEAFCRWDNLYPVLTAGASGLFGAMTGRGEAQVVRLATLYALLDGSELIRLQHLEAAQEVWGYCEESVRFIFGDVYGDDTADAIVKLLKNAPGGMTQTEINRSFGGHKSTAELSRALSFLRGKGRAELEREVTGGGMATRWRLCAD
jgi:Protein of unknown function (DUF3987)